MIKKLLTSDFPVEDKEVTANVPVPPEQPVSSHNEIRARHEKSAPDGHCVVCSFYVCECPPISLAPKKQTRYKNCKSCGTLLDFETSKQLGKCIDCRQNEGLAK